MPRTIKFSIKIPSLCNCKRRRETRPAEFPGVPSSIASTESFLTKSEKELSAEGQVVGTGDLRKILMNQQKDLSKLLKAYLAASKKLENYRYFRTWFVFTKKEFQRQTTVFRAKDLFLEHLCREMDIEAIKKENFVPELLNAHFSVWNLIIEWL